MSSTDAARPSNTAREAIARDQAAYVLAELGAGSARILEVGCGHGRAALLLANAGHTVVALDIALPSDLPQHPSLTFVEADLYAYSGSLFDAVAFTASLHHMPSPKTALNYAATLLKPGGLLIIDDFDVRAVDRSTARWYFEVQELLAIAGIYDASRIEGASTDDPETRWHRAHEHEDERLHAGREMCEAVELQFDNVRVGRGPYLWRYLATGVTGDNADSLREFIQYAERARVAEESIRAVGLRIVARAVHVDSIK